MQKTIIDKTLIVLGAVGFVILGLAILGNQKSSAFGDVTTGPYYSAATNSSVTCAADTSTLVLGTGSARTYFITTNDSANTVYLCKALTCAASTGIRLNADGGAYEQKVGDLYVGPYSCYSPATSSVLTLTYNQ